MFTEALLTLHGSYTMILNQRKVAVDFITGKMDVKYEIATPLSEQNVL